VGGAGRVAIEHDPGQRDEEPDPGVEHGGGDLVAVFPGFHGGGDDRGQPWEQRRHQQEQQVRADQSGIDSADAGEQVVVVDPDCGDVEERGEVGEVAGPLLEQGG
jgi:hypothetical protein